MPTPIAGLTICVSIAFQWSSVLCGCLLGLYGNNRERHSRVPRSHEQVEQGGECDTACDLMGNTETEAADQSRT